MNLICFGRANIYCLFQNSFYYVYYGKYYLINCNYTGLFSLRHWEYRFQNNYARWEIHYKNMEREDISNINVQLLSWDIGLSPSARPGSLLRQQARVLWPISKELDWKWNSWGTNQHPYGMLVSQVATLPAALQLQPHQMYLPVGLRLKVYLDSLCVQINYNLWIHTENRENFKCWEVDS